MYVYMDVRIGRILRYRMNLDRLLINLLIIWGCQKNYVYQFMCIICHMNFNL